MAGFSIDMGVPEMDALWTGLLAKQAAGNLGGGELRLLKKLQKTLPLLAANPRHPGLASHEIESLSRRFGAKVWQSCLENRTPAAGRLFWVYGPEKGVITIVGLEAHPESSKVSGYSRVKLSTFRVMKVRKAK